jgi:hypothetical protein
VPASFGRQKRPGATNARDCFEPRPDPVRLLTDSPVHLRSFLFNLVAAFLSFAVSAGSFAPGIENILTGASIRIQNR